MKFSAIFTIVLFLISVSFSSFAQTPEQIDVKSLEISKSGASGATFFKMEALNSIQNSVVYQAPDSAALGIVSFTIACPCGVPNQYNTNVFPAEMIASLGQNGGRIRFYISSSTSSPIFLNQRVLSKKRDFTINGTTRLEGRIEVRNNADQIIAVDNNVVLDGGFSVLYYKPYILPSGRRATDFKNLIYKLSAP